jgi:hypothetical protein
MKQPKNYSSVLILFHWCFHSTIRLLLYTFLHEAGTHSGMLFGQKVTEFNVSFEFQRLACPWSAAN